MIKIFEGYAFVQVNTFGIIQQIDEEKFENYSKLLKIFLPIQDLYRAYRNVNLQFYSIMKMIYKNQVQNYKKHTLFILKILVKGDTYEKIKKIFNSCYFMLLLIFYSGFCRCRKF